MADLSQFGLAPAGFGASSPVAQTQTPAMPPDIPSGASPSVAWPHDDPTSWDTLFLGGQWPGIVTIEVKGGQKIDRKKGAGTHGETITFQGAKAADVDIKLRIWQRTPDEWQWLQSMIAIVEPVPGKKNPTPFDIVHPVTAVRGITSVAVEEIDGPSWDPSSGFMTVHIKAVQYLPPPKVSATATPTGSKSSAKATDSATPAVDPANPGASFYQNPKQPQDAVMVPPHLIPDALLDPGLGR